MLNALGIFTYLFELIVYAFLWLLTLFKRIIYYQVILYMARIKIFPYPLPEFTEKTRILLLITHTDDGCIYFGPLIVTFLHIKNCELYVMCMLHEKYTQSERIFKKKELLKSCSVLGIPEGNVILVTRQFVSPIPFLNNTFTACAKCVLNHIEGIDADYIYTFDKNGVNRHPDHMFLFRTLSYMCMRKIIPVNCRVFKLQTISILRRFSCIADLLISEWKSQHIFIVSPTERRRIKEALMVHKTQSRWYNQILFQMSRYSYINTMEEMSIYKSLTIGNNFDNTDDNKK